MALIRSDESLINDLPTLDNEELEDEYNARKDRLANISYDDDGKQITVRLGPTRRADVLFATVQISFELMTRGLIDSEEFHRRNERYLSEVRPKVPLPV